MQASEVLSHAQPRTLTRADYDRIVEQGIFGDERVELVYGIVVAMYPIGAAHADPEGGRYRRMRTFAGDDTIAPQAFADLSLRVSDLFAA